MSPLSPHENVSASEVANLAGVDVKREVFDALEMNAYCVTAAVDYLINVRRPLLPPYGTFDWSHFSSVALAWSALLYHALFG